MKRYAHYWFPIKGASYPQRIAVLDCDSRTYLSGTSGRVQTEQLTAWYLHVSEIRRGVPVSCRRECGETAEGFQSRLSQLLELKGATWLFVSPAQRVLANCGLWSFLETLTVSFAVIEDPPTVLSVKQTGTDGRMLILDVRNYGIELLPPEMTGNERCQRYLDTLCQILHTLREGRFGSLRCTAGSQAVSALRTKYDCIRLHCHTHERATALERAAYHGGRCECYRIRNITGEVFHVDVRSMYPSICLNLPIPVSLRCYYADGARAEEGCRADPSACAADVQVRVKMPAFCYRLGGDTVYPVGNFRTVLCGPELARAIGDGVITKWYSGARYTCANYLRPFFADWLDMLQRARASGAVQVAQWIKRVMNALVGKFGEPGRQWESVSDRTEHGPYGVWTDADEEGNQAKYRNIAWHTERQRRDGESYWSMPAVAAWITAAGRIRLWDYILAAGRPNVWYVDTDSLITNRAGFDALLHGGFVRDGETGYLRLLGTHSECTIFGIRHYCIDRHVTCAGVPRGTIKPGESRIEYWERRGIKREVALGRRPSGDLVLVSQDRVEPYRHGNVQEDGTVTPLEIWESE